MSLLGFLIARFLISFSLSFSAQLGDVEGRSRGRVRCLFHLLALFPLSPV